MASIHAELTARFRSWEERTRGRLVYPFPVTPEPPFVPYPGHWPSSQSPEDDGKRPTFLSSLFQGLWAKKAVAPEAEEEDSLELTPLEREEVVELPLFLPESFETRGDGFNAFLRSLFCHEPLALELVGTAKHVTAQLAVSSEDCEHVRERLRSFFPALVSTPTSGGLDAAWADGADIAGVVEFGLARECMLPLASTPLDAYVALVGALSDLREGECAVFQVLWQSVENPWSEHLVRSVTNAMGGPVFVNAPELAGAANNKVSRSLFAAVVRVAACSPAFDRTWDILRTLAAGLRPFAHPNGNELVPLRNDGYPFQEHIEDILRRQSRRAGMILNSDELLGLVHLPSSAVRSPKFRRQVRKTKAAPEITARADGLLLGLNEHGGEVREVRLSREQRTRHLHLIGASGTGKTTMLFNLIRQDLESGDGLAVLDPHGDLIDRILGVVPPERIKDVVLLDPGDEEYSVGFNILSAHSDLEKTLLASDLVSTFERLSTSWGDQMGVVLNNAIRAFLESDVGGTLADLRRFLLEPKYREQFLKTVRDPDIVYYWRKGFAQLTGNKSIGPVMTRLELFLGPKPIRYMVSQRENRLNFADILDSGKIFLAKLSQGTIGKENSYLLGSLLMAKFQQVAMGRQTQSESSRRDFWVYIDEFHNFITPSTAEMLSGARKYRVGLTLAHQELRQLQRDSEVASAVLSNPYTRVCFRVGDQDARTLEHGFANFEARDLQNLETGEAICRVERSDFDFNLSISLPELPDEAEAAARRREVREESRRRYATPRAEIEAALHSPSDAGEESETEQQDPPTPKTPKTRRVIVVVTPDDEEARPAQSDTPVIDVSVSPVPAEETPTTVPALPVGHVVVKHVAGDEGRGGNQHKAIQKRIKEAADALGFRSSIEETIMDGAGSVDVMLSRGDLRIACEITVTTTIDHEVGNVAKCIKAGFTEVAVISSSADKLSKIESAVAASLGKDLVAGVRYYLPDQLIEYLKSIPKPQPVQPAPQVRVSRGYKVKRTYPTLTPEEAKAREDAAIQAIADAMRKKK